MLELGRNPRLVQLSKNFSQFALPLLKAQYKRQMDEYKTTDPAEVDPCIVKGTSHVALQFILFFVPLPCCHLSKWKCY